MDRLFDQMDRLFDQMRDRIARTEIGTNIREMGWPTGPAIHVYEEDEATIVVADLPGYEREEIDLTIHGNVLQIRAEHEADSGHVTQSRSVSERVTLPTEVVDDEATATYHNGVLEVCLPYSEESERSHRIDID